MRPDQNVLKIESGFKIYYLITKYENDKQNMLVEMNEDEEFNSFKFILTGVLSVGSKIGSFGIKYFEQITNYLKRFCGKPQDNTEQYHEEKKERDSNEILKSKF